MRKLLLAAALAASCSAIPAYAASDTECTAMWKKADVNNDGWDDLLIANGYITTPDSSDL